MGSDRTIPGLLAGVEIEIQSVGSDLEIKGRPGGEIRAKGDNENIHVEDDGKRVTIWCGGDCKLEVPTDAMLRINSVGSDARITEVSGQIEIGNVGSDLVLRDTGPVIIHGVVGSDLEIRRASGDVTVEVVGSDASFRGIEGNLSVRSIGSDALVTNVKGECHVESVGSDLVFNLAFPLESRSRFKVGSDVLGKVPPDASVRFLVPVGTEVDVHIPGAKVEQNNDHVVVTLGEGKSEVEFVSIGGDFQLVSADDKKRGKDGFDFDVDVDVNFGDDLAEMINRRVNEQIARVNEQIGPMIDRVTRQAQDQIERQAERLARRADRHSRGKSWQFSWPDKPKRDEADFSWQWPEKPKRGDSASEPVTNEERMTILRMVENKQISVEEAERLLAALEDES